jgi:hypothetical protein
MKNRLLGVIIGLGLVAGSMASKAEVIWYKGHGDRQSYTKYSTVQYVSERVDFGVWPVAYGHTAGSVYTDDGWTTATWATAKWEANVSNPYGGQDESWSVRLFGGGSDYIGQPFQPFTFEFALYVKNSSNQMFWENNGGMNHRIFINSP